MPVAAAARAVGVSKAAGRDWFSKGGGVRPATERRDLEASASVGRGRLTFTDRCRIEELMLAHYRPARIAALLGRPRSTITRELDRGRTNPGQRYRAVIAQAAVENKARRPKVMKLQPGTALWNEVASRLRKRHSPEQISNCLRIDFPSEPEMWVSHETIYQALYVQGRGSLREEIKRALRSGRVRRIPQGRTTRPGPVRNMVNISERPAEANDRAVPGHWEGDLIMGAGNRSAIGTLVERTTGFVMLLHLPDDHSAATVAEAMTAAIPKIPEVMQRSLTWDQGSEMALHTKITEATGLPIYFCDPHSPWQRGTNENTNGLLRQYFPKGTDLSVHGPGILANVAAELNGRPRKRHNWKTPTEELDRLLQSDESSVA
ncbi:MULTISPECIES: IS30 family transposase [Gordonia]|nr:MULTISPECIES: IS30 family transposase [Gordonia]UKO94026.1 IS30 family transposase [Gordonia amicalis]UKO94107.1 IS30 family transposase [Gordonia amicalis]